MAQEKQLQENNISQLSKGLHTDNSQIDSPKGTYRFALNSVNETELGDFGFISNEESNEECASLTPGYVPIGKCYIGNNETVIFSVSSDNTVSEIGILDNNCNYTIYVNDKDSSNKDKLNFKLEYQIQATFRLRRGCERTLYFTDNLNPVRYIDLDNLHKFKNKSGTFAANKFNLFRVPNKVPELTSLEILEGNGSLTPGNYSVLVQYLDADFNPTQFIEIASNINIYNDSLNNLYHNITGTLNLDTLEASAYKYEDTNKSIAINMGNLDESFPYMRYAFVHNTSGTGLVSKTRYSDIISTSNVYFVYTGKNASTEGTINEVNLANIENTILKASHIEQIENRLILANTSGQEVNFNSLQKYASKIKADCIVKKISLTDIKEKYNSKNPLSKHYGLSYQPGEVYSFGIFYIFEDFTTSPVYHIPGKSPKVSETLRYTVGDNVYPMSNVNNENISERYTESESCNTNYWSRDSEGDLLQNKPVRHHRFPTRDSLKLPLVESSNTMTESKFNILNLFLDGIIKSSVVCGGEPNCTNYTAPKFTLIVRYKVNGIDHSFESYVNPDSSFNRTSSSEIYDSNKSITDIKLFYKEEKVDEDSEQEVEISLTNNTSQEQPNGLTYKINITNKINSEGTTAYNGYHFGIKFSSIEIPTSEVIGKKIIGYQIVRQERKDEDKTILDSGVLFPNMKNNNFITSALLNPELDTDPNSPFYYKNKLSTDTVSIISPGHKFADKTYDNFTTIEQVGKFTTKNVTQNAFQVQDIFKGSSADGVDTTPQTSDSDGFSLKHSIKYTEVEYNSLSITDKALNIPSTNSRMYNLNAVNYADSINGDKVIYNLASDNKILILNSKDTPLELFKNNKREFPYVYIKKNNNTFYQNFRNNRYFTVSNTVFETTQDNCEVFGGDIFIAPLRYSNHVFLNAILAIRKQRQSVWKILGAIFTIIAGIILTIIAPPAGIGLLVAVGGGLLALGGIAMGAAAIVENEKFIQIYSEKWEQGLDKTVHDKFYQWIFRNPNLYQSNQIWYRDDCINWTGEVLGDLWFETPYNISLRVPPRTHSNNFLNPLENHMGQYSNNTYAASNIYYDRRPRGYRYNDDNISIEGNVANFFYNKIFSPDNTTNSKYKYNGISLPIVYIQNLDFSVSTKIKSYYGLPISYDGCSSCSEKFPHRIHYSEQSFQEEKTDNYRVFLPNNYRDIEGETGEITNIFRFYNNLFVHTKEALWKMGRSYQERITDNVVSFIGTGSYFEIPPQKLIDDDTGASAGTQHKWSGIKTPNGYFFVTENQKKIYQFDGEKLNAISNIGMSNWFKNNLQIQLDKEFYNQKGYDYPNRDNPSNKIGTGFISTYDTKKERIIFTKKDVKLDTNIYGEDTQICTNGDSVTIFPNFSNTISSQAAAGWYFEGVENCKLKFSKQIIKTRMEPREVTTTIPNNADIIVHLDMSGSFNPTTRTQIKNAVGQWLSAYSSSNPNWTGRVFFSEQEGYTSQRCWRVLRFIKDGLNIKDISGNSIPASSISKNIVAVSFVNENLIGRYGSNICYHPQLTNPMGNYASDFIDDYTDFKNLYNQHIATGGTFHALNYPINYGTEIAYMTQGFVQHVLAVLKGVSYTQVEVDALIPNPFMSTESWNTLKASLLGNNIYPDDGLENYGWKGITNRGWNGSGDVITAEQFQVDMNQFLQGITSTETVMTEIEYLDTEYNYIDGQVIQNPVHLDNSWTISYSLKGENWVSWHSYMPNFYINIPEKFYSWKHGSNKIWKHNKLGHFQTYYGEYKPHIVEYTSLSNPITTRIWNHIMLQTEAKTYNYDLKQYHDERYVTFNKAILYNSRQCSGEMDLVIKDEELGGQDYMMNQVINTNVNQSIIDRNERDWLINDFRDIRIDYTKPIWNSNISSLQSEYFIDKILNTSTLDINKDWTQLESFRDKYLVVRLIFDKFANKKLITNFSVENEQQSFY